MKKALFFSAAVLTAALARGDKVVHAYDRDVVVREANYDVSKIGSYTLEDPLTFLDGRKVTTAEEWGRRRREILDIFAREMYGQEPPNPETLITELQNEKVAVGGYAIRRLYKMWFKPDKSGPCINWIVWIPRFAKQPAPVILFLNYNGNHELVPDKDIPLMEAWCRLLGNGEFDAARSEQMRGKLQDPNMAAIFPLATILARGYAVMSACYCEVSPDAMERKQNGQTQSDFAYTGVFELWGKRDPARDDNTTSLGAWGWALCRGMDLAERIPELDTKRSVVTGYSRLAKAALVAAARDARFAICVPNQTGGGGCPLAKRNYGENVSTQNRAFPHWFCPAYAKYAADPAKLLTFDQHLFLACIAPRGLLIQGFDEKWFDTEGEFLAIKAASPVWRQLGHEALPEVDYPKDFDTSAIGKNIGYVRRSQGHGFSGYDWMWTLDFADRYFGIKK